METALKFYVNKALELGIDEAELNQQGCDVAPNEDGMAVSYRSRENPNGLTILVTASLKNNPNTKAIDKGGRVLDIDEVMEKEYEFSMINRDNVVVEMNIRGPTIVGSLIGAQYQNPTISIPKKFFEVGEPYKCGLTWMLETYMLQ